MLMNWILSFIIVSNENAHHKPRSWMILSIWTIQSFLFWIKGILMIYTPSVKSYSIEILFIFLYGISILLLLIKGILSHFEDYINDEDIGLLSPEERAGFISKLFFSWLNPLFNISKKRPLQMDDLYELGCKEKARRLSSLFHTLWYDKAENQEKKSLFNVILNVMWLDLLISGILRLLHDIFIFLGPFFLRKLIQFINDRTQPLWIGIIYITAMTISSILQSILLHQYLFKANRMSMNVKAGIITLIYTKLFKMSSDSRKKYSSGNIVNLQSSDSSKIESIFPVIHLIWSAPLQIIISFIMLWNLLGVSIIAGVSILVFLVPVNLKITKILSGNQRLFMAKKDARIKLMNEILQSIRAIKFYSWESNFSSQITNLRNEELEVLKKNTFTRALTTLIWEGTPLFVSISTFCLHTYLGHQLTAEKTFTALSLLNILKFSISILPTVIIRLIEGRVSLKRIDEYLLSDDIKDYREGSTKDEVNAIVFKNASFEWQKNTPVLSNLNLNIKRGSLTAVIGTVGHGKSSLLSALLGEINKIKGEVFINGSISYCPQQPWIQNATFRENILFGKDYDEIRYDNALKLCELKEDLSHFQGGDLIEIGEKGINLSGGQKQRISLARGFYQDSDIYIFDDPFSSLDVHVGANIYDNLVRKALRNKTRILVTHQLQYLPFVDHIIILKEGNIIEQGTYSDLMNNGKEFKTLLENHKLLSFNNVNSSDYYEHSTASHPKVIQEKDSQSKIITHENRITGHVGLHVYLNYIRAIGGFKTLLMIMLLFITVSLSMLGSDYFLSYWSNDTERHSLYFYITTYTFIGIFISLLLFIRSLYTSHAALNASISIHQEMLQSVLRSPISFFYSTPIGRILNRFSKDQDTIDINLPSTLESSISTFLIIVNIFFIIGSVTPLFVLFLIPILLIYRYYHNFYLLSSRELQRINGLVRSPIFSLFGETFNGLSTIKAYNKVKEFSLMNERNIDRSVRSYFIISNATRWLGVRLEFIGSLIVAVSSLFAILGRYTEASLAGMSITYALRITSQLSQLVRISSNIENDLVSVERCDEYTKLMPEINRLINSPIPKDWISEGIVKFENVYFRYHDDLPYVLKDLTFEIKGKEKVGIVGRTGAGKSSIMNALFRMKEITLGSIYIDNVNIKSINLHDLRSQLTIILQDPILFKGTIRSNLDPFRERDDNELWKVLEQCQIKSQVEKMKDQLDSNVLENGENLSLGTRQLICLSRAILKKPKILILDEATASVDFETDSLIQKTIKEQFSNSTVIVIAHRIQTVLDCDKIIVIDKGNVIEFDKPQNLLNNPKSLFNKLYKQAY